MLGLGGVNKGQLVVGILRNQAIIDKIIDQFELMEVYEEKYRVQMREVVISRILQAEADIQSGIITVSVLDKDPEKAAQMANSFIGELQNVMQSLAIGEAAQRRVFFEGQARQAYELLSNAEDELQKYQEKSGLVAIEPQMEALLSSIASMRAQIAAKEVEISSLRTYAKSRNPQLRRAESELAALKNELTKLEEQEQEKNSKGSTFPTDSLREAPQRGLEYQRKLRDVKYATTMYELVMKQRESAKMDESSDLLFVQVLNFAVPPDYKFKPKRALIVIEGIASGLVIGVLWAFYSENRKRYANPA
jgi:capsule polysaccharide export protein KpsE/RkpR